MKKTWRAALILLAALAVIASGCSALDDSPGPAAAPAVEPVAAPLASAPNEASAEETEEAQFGARGAMAEESFTIEGMLLYAIEDEYLARQEYESIMEEFGEQNPFRNIMVAEERHIAMLIEIYQVYDYPVPQDEALDHVVIPESIAVALEIGVQAEIDNIAMYEKFLEHELPDDIRAVFVELRDGSVNHLAAFERGVRGNGKGK